MGNHISPEYLATLAKRRDISTIFEKEWIRRTGVNPVADAVIMAEVKQQEFSRITRKNAMAFLIIMSTFCFLLTVLLTLYAINTPSIRGEFSFALSAITVFSLIVVLVTAGEFRSVSRQPTYLPVINSEEVRRFCEHLYGLVTWSCYLKKTALLSGDDESLRGVAREILIEAAKEQLKLQRRMASCTTEEKTHFQVTLGQLGVTLSHRYDTLKNLGLVPEGGYDRYFAIARRQLKEEMEKAPT